MPADSLLGAVLYFLWFFIAQTGHRERERKEKEKSERKKDAKAKGRKNKVPKLNDKIPPNFDFIPISRVFSVKPKTVFGESDNWGSRQRYLRKPGEGGALS